MVDLQRDHDSSQNDLEEAKQEELLTKVKSNISIAETLSPFREFMFVSLICLAQFMTQASLGGTLSIIHVIGNDFGITNPGDLSWFIAAYSLTVSTFILIAGKFGDLFGYKKMYIIGFSWFAIWSIVAGLSVYSNYVLFNFSRVFQGIGPAIILPKHVSLLPFHRFCLKHPLTSFISGIALFGATYEPGRRKAMVFSLFGACAPGGSVVGATFAGIFALAWWPWAFWSFAIACIIIAIVGYHVIPNPPLKRSRPLSLHETFLELDPLGSIIGITALILFSFAWNQAGVVGWRQAYVYICLIISCILVPVFFYIELYVTKAPLIPFRALSTDVSFVLGCVACGWSCFGIWLYYLWQFIEQLRHASPLLASAWLSPSTVSGAIASITTGFLLTIIGPAPVMTVALSAFCVGTILLATMPINQTYWAQMFVSIIITPWGMVSLF